jgi:hypothetical protein
MALTSRSELRRGGHPGVTIVLHQRPGQAGMRAATIGLPRVLRLDPAAGATPCTRARALEGRCPRAAAVGSARMRTPLLARPLNGTLDVVQPIHGTQPDLWATIAGSGVHLILRGATSAPPSGPIETAFGRLPDLPLTALELHLRGGTHGLLALASGLCTGGRARPIAIDAGLRAHNGKRRRVRVPVHADPVCAR